MATTIAHLMAVVGADTKPFEQGMGKVHQGLDDAKSKSEGASGGITGFIKAALPIAAVAGGAKLVGDAIMGMVGAANESAQVMAQTEAGIKSTGGVAGVTVQKVTELAWSISKLSGIDDEAVQTGENMLLTFTGIGKDVFPAATQAVADMATKMNGGRSPAHSRCSSRHSCWARRSMTPLPA